MVNPLTLLRQSRPAVCSTESPSAIDVAMCQSFMWAFLLRRRGLSQVELSVGNADEGRSGGGFTARAGDDQKKCRKAELMLLLPRWLVVPRVGEMTGHPDCTWTGS